MAPLKSSGLVAKISPFVVPTTIATMLMIQEASFMVEAPSLAVTFHFPQAGELD